jgi:hypothetical protein
MRDQVSALALVVLHAFGFAAVQAQSLAEVARQEQERRKSLKTEAKVYTNKDLRSAPAARPVQPKPAPDTAPSSAGGDAASRTDSPEAQPTVAQEKERDQTYWSGRMKDLQAALERNQTYLDALQSRINALTTDFVNRDDPAQRARIATDRDRAVAEFERLKVQIERDRKAIVDFEEEARRAGVPPGWLR